MKEATEDPSRNTCVAPHVGECGPGLDTPTEVCWQLGHVDPSVAEQRVPHTGPIPFEALLVAVPGGARVEGPFVLPDTHPCGRTRPPNRPSPAIACVMLAPCHLWLEMTQVPFNL